jgi:hypothetical protein
VRHTTAAESWSEERNGGEREKKSLVNLELLHYYNFDGVSGKCFPDSMCKK